MVRGPGRRSEAGRVTIHQALKLDAEHVLLPETAESLSWNGPSTTVRVCSSRPMERFC